MNNIIVKNSIRFIVLLLTQVLIFSKLNLFGYINPFVYVLFMVLYPINENKSFFIFISFLLGLSIDVFSNSGGIHAAACATIAYIRPALLRFSFGMNYEFQAIRIDKTPIGQRAIYLLILILIHHFIIFSLDFFSFTHILSILKRTLLSGLLTLILSLILIPLFSAKK